MTNHAERKNTVRQDINKSAIDDLHGATPGVNPVIPEPHHNDGGGHQQPGHQQPQPPQYPQQPQHPQQQHPQQPQQPQIGSPPTLKEFMKPPLRAALRKHEIGNGSPYELSFAGIDNSGATFGFMQGDLNTNKAAVEPILHRVLVHYRGPNGRALSSTEIDLLKKKLSGPHKSNPLNPSETKIVNEALRQGKALVDAMDESLFKVVENRLNKCMKAAYEAKCTIQPEALIYMALWVNMTGEPTSLLDWLKGSRIDFTWKDENGNTVTSSAAPPDVHPPESTVVGEDDILAYVKATKFYKLHNDRLGHLQAAVKTGAALLPKSKI